MTGHHEDDIERRRVDRRQPLEEVPITTLSGLAISAAERTLNKQGFATLIALCLILWLAMMVSGRMESIDTKLNNHISETTYLLQQLCINAAKDDAQARRCILPKDR